MIQCLFLHCQRGYGWHMTNNSSPIYCIEVPVCFYSPIPWGFTFVQMLSKLWTKKALHLKSNKITEMKIWVQLKTTNQTEKRHENYLSRPLSFCINLPISHVHMYRSLLVLLFLFPKRNSDYGTISLRKTQLMEQFF